MRIALAGIQHETNTFSPLPTRLEDFTVRRGPALIDAFGVADPQVELVPIAWSSAVPGGIVERAAYETLKDEVVRGLAQALPVDGVCLGLHGAMEVAGIAKAEADLLAALRTVVGPRVPITASFDLHANLTQEMVDGVEAFSAYRTAPHRDSAQSRQRAYRLLMRCLREGARPVSALVKLPFVLQGEKGITDVEPMASLIALSEEIEGTPGIISALILVGCAWTDVPHVTTSALVTADGDRDLAQQAARRLAAAYWERRAAFRFDVPTGSMDECIDAALASGRRPFFITDSGDNPTAGAPGDVPVFIERLLAKQVPDAVYAAIPDAAAAAVCQAAGVGARVTLSLGGKLDFVTAPPLELTGEVRSVWRDAPTGETGAVLRVAGLDVIVTSHRRAYTTPAQFRQAGIEPLERQIIVTKQGYLFAELRAIAAGSMMALSPGFADQVIQRLPYRRLPRPVYPWDAHLEWSPPENAGV